jgi:alpha-L-fucosidase
MPSTPAYLSEYESTYKSDPRAAAVEWFEDAKYGLFLHYGLYSLLGNHEWVQYDETIPPAEYARLQGYFTAENFDAEAIVEFAQDAGMGYINVTTKHHDGFCLFDTDQTSYKSTAAPAGRDLVGELAAACHDAGLGLFCYYSVGVDWAHPHAPNREDWGRPARPDYDERPGNYADAGHDLNRYRSYVEAQCRELLEYEPAGIWFDPAVFSTQPGKAGWDPDPFDLPALYETIREAREETLISFKDGVTGSEDFVAPELYYESHREELDKPGEVCACMLPSEEYEDEIRHSWGYMKAAEGKHKTESEVWDLLRETRSKGYNLLLNTGPLPDGSLDPKDTKALRRVGDRIADGGFPTDGGET